MTIYKYFFKLKKKCIIFNLDDIVLFPLLSVLFLKTSKQRGGISILLTLRNCTLYPFSSPLLSPFLPPCSFYSRLPPHFQTHFKSFQRGCHICTYLVYEHNSLSLINYGFWKKIIEKKEINKEKMKLTEGPFFWGNSYPESQFFNLTLAIYNWSQFWLSINYCFM